MNVLNAVEPKAFEDVAFDHMNALFNLARHLTGNSADAEDLVQETYLRAYKHYDKFAQGTNFKAWIFRILRNTSISRYKQERNHGNNVSLEVVEPRLEAPGDRSCDHRGPYSFTVEAPL